MGVKEDGAIRNGMGKRPPLRGDPSAWGRPLVGQELWLGVNLHSVDAGCSVACLEWEWWIGEIRIELSEDQGPYLV